MVLYAWRGVRGVDCGMANEERKSRLKELQKMHSELVEAGAVAGISEVPALKELERKIRELREGRDVETVGEG